MRTVAEVRRELGVGAPREKNSLYRPIERAPRKFNPLKIPKQLQVCAAALSSIWQYHGRDFSLRMNLLELHDRLGICAVHVYPILIICCGEMFTSRLI